MRIADHRYSNPQSSVPSSSGPALARRICAAFDAWLAEHEDQPDLWAPFDQLIRELLTEHLAATRVRCYHVRPGCDTLQTLSQASQLRVADCASRIGESPIVNPQSAIHSPQLRSGVLGHAATTGKEFVADDLSHGPLVDHLAKSQSAIDSRQSLDQWAWVWPVRERRATVGVIAVGKLPGPPTSSVGPPSPTSLLSGETRRTIGHLVSLCWRHVACLERLRVARKIDQASGVLTRNDFFTLAANTLADSYHAHEPVVVAVLALEGVRHLDDTGRWRERDALIDRLGRLITRRVRSDDLVGRFADDRFVVLLRRLDSGLGRLIAEQMLASAAECVPEPKGAAHQARLRIGLAGSGLAQPPLDELLEAAFEAAVRARKENLPLWTDLEAVSDQPSAIHNPQSDSSVGPPPPTEATEK